MTGHLARHRLLFEPATPAFDSFARCGGCFEHLQRRIDFQSVRFQDREVTIEIWDEVNLVDDQNRGIPEHAGVLEGLVIPFCRACDDNLRRLPEIIVCRTDEVSYILNDKELYAGGWMVAHCFHDAIGLIGRDNGDQLPLIGHIERAVRDRGSQKFFSRRRRASHTAKNLDKVHLSRTTSHQNIAILTTGCYLPFVSPDTEAKSG